MKLWSVHYAYRLFKHFDINWKVFMLDNMEQLDLDDIINLTKSFAGNSREIGEFCRESYVIEAAMKRARKLIGRNTDVKTGEKLLKQLTKVNFRNNDVEKIMRKHGELLVTQVRVDP